MFIIITMFVNSRMLACQERVHHKDAPITVDEVFKCQQKSQHRFHKSVLDMIEHDDDPAGDRKNQMEWLSPEDQLPNTIAATCEFEGKIMAHANKALFNSTMWTAVPAFAQKVVYSHFAVKMQTEQVAQTREHGKKKKKPQPALL